MKLSAFILTFFTFIFSFFSTVFASQGDSDENVPISRKVGVTSPDEKKSSKSSRLKAHTVPKARKKSTTEEDDPLFAFLKASSKSSKENTPHETDLIPEKKAESLWRTPQTIDSLVLLEIIEGKKPILSRREARLKGIKFEGVEATEYKAKNIEKEIKETPEIKATVEKTDLSDGTKRIKATYTSPKVIEADYSLTQISDVLLTIRFSKPKKNKEPKTIV